MNIFHIFIPYLIFIFTWELRSWDAICCFLLCKQILMSTKSVSHRFLYNILFTTTNHFRMYGSMVYGLVARLRVFMLLQYVLAWVIIEVSAVHTYIHTRYDFKGKWSIIRYDWTDWIDYTIYVYDYVAMLTDAEGSNSEALNVNVFAHIRYISRTIWQK